jgi:hypothetical protein
MTTPLTTTKNRTIVAAVLAGGLLTSLSACGGSSTTATTVSESQPIQGSPMVACGMAQLTPRVADNDPVLGRANTFFTQLEQAQLVPPAVQNVYNTGVGQLNSQQQNEVLLMLSSLNECPGLTPQAQQSVLDTFNQLAPQTVADPSTSGSATTDSGSSTDSSSNNGQPVVIQSSNTTVDDSSSNSDVWWDGEWNGHPWWFRPAWDHPVTDTADWVQWGTDRRAGIVWRWQDNGWRRIGRPTDAPANRPWLPAVIGPGRLAHDPGTAPLNQQPLPGAPTPPPVPGQAQLPGQAQVPQVNPQATASAKPDVTAPQQVTRPDFRDPRPGDITGQPGATAGVTSSSAPTAAPTKPDQQPARVGTGTTGNATRGTDSSTTTVTGPDSSTTEHDRVTENHAGTGGAQASTPTPAPKPNRSDDTRDRTQQSGDNSRGSDSVGVQSGTSTDNHRTTDGQS